MKDERISALRSYLAEDSARIKLSEMLQAAREELYGALAAVGFSIASAISFSDEELARRVAAYEEVCAVPIEMMMEGGRWARTNQISEWRDFLERIASPPTTGGENSWLDVWRSLSLYPALLLLYAGGISSQKAENYDFLATLLTQVPVRVQNDMYLPAGVALYPIAVLRQEVAQRLPKMERRHTPLNDRIFDLLRPYFSAQIPDDEMFNRQFDRFEYLLALVHSDIHKIQLGRGTWAPTGRFGWRSRLTWDVAAEFTQEIDAKGADHPLLQAKLFDGDLQRLLAARASYNELLGKIRAHW